MLVTIDDGGCGISVEALADLDIRGTSAVADAVFLLAAPQIAGDIGASVVANGQRTIPVAAVARTDSAAASLFASSLGNDGTAGDGDIAAVAVLTTADTGAPVVALGIDVATADGDGGAVGILTATNTCSVLATVGIDPAAGDGQLATLLSAVHNFFHTAANACCILTGLGIDIATGDGDVSTATISSAANSCSPSAAVGIDHSAGHKELTCRCYMAIIIVARAYTGTKIISDSFHIAAMDGNVAAITIIAATDTCTARISTVGFNMSAIDGDGTAGATFGSGIGAAAATNACSTG